MNIVKTLFALCLVCFAGSAIASPSVPVHISLKADSAPVVGKEGIVTATVTVDHDLPDVTVDILLPTEGKVVGSPKLTVAHVSKGTPVEFKAKVVFSTPGTKTVRAVVKSAESPGVVWSSVAYLLMDIGGTKSSIITDTSRLRGKPELISKGNGKSIGRPVKDANEAKSSPAPRAADGGGVDGPTTITQLNPGELVVTGRWTFSDRAGTVVGQKHNLVELRSGALFHPILATTYTDASGNFTFPVVNNPGAKGVFVRCRTYSHITGNVATVSADSAYDYYSSDTDITVFSDGTRSIGSWNVRMDNPNIGAWWIVDDMTKAYKVPPDPTGGHFVIWSPTSTHGSHYHPGSEIHLEGPDCETPDVPLHEMGHSVQYNIYGDYLPNVGGSHSLFVRSSMELAWIEGWATAWLFWVTDDPVFNLPGGGAVDMENRTWGDGGDEGADVEGRVTGALWDIADGVNDGYDTYTGGWLDIWHVMYNHNCDTFWEFWQQWKAHAFDSHGPIKCLYQNTISWNTPPAFGGLPNISIAEDEFRANAMDLDDYASDQESYDYQLVFGVVNVSTPNLQIGIDAHHRVNMQGVLNWHGTAEVEIWCTDGLTTVGDTFTVTVTPVNDPPVIKNVPDISLDEDGYLSHTINLSSYTTDPETLSHLLTYSIRSNTNPSCGVSLVGGYYISVNPAANWFGTSDVTIRATDPQGLWSEDTYRITVNAVNDPPVIANLPDRTLNEDTSLINTIDLWAYTTDLEIPSSALSYYVQSSELPAGAVTISSNRYVSIIPPANYYGSGNVTIRVWDWESGWGEDTLLVTVNPMPDPPVCSIPDHTYPFAKATTTRSVDLHAFASDPDGPPSELIYTITGNTNASFGLNILRNRTLQITQPGMFTGYTQITIRATDPTGNWVEDSFNVLVGRKCAKCSEAFDLPDGTWVYFDPKTVTFSYYYSFYIEDDARTSGIRINSTINPGRDAIVAIGGQLTTNDGERALDCVTYARNGTNPTPPRPLGMNHRFMGGVWPSDYTPAVPTGRQGGPYNVGLLVRTTGKVVSRNLNSFWIADGSGVHYSFSSKGLYVDCQPIAMYAPTLGSRVTVTGISGASTLLDGKVVNTLRLRDRVDVKGLGGKVAYVYNSASSTAAAFATMLGEYGWETTTIPLSQLINKNLSSYDVVILGADTGTWSDSGRVLHLINSDKPIIAMGSGGARFLDQAPNLYIGWLNSALTEGVQGYVADLSSVLYWWESIISVPTNRMLNMLTTSVYSTSLLNPPSGVYGLLRHPTNSSYWIVAQEGQFMQWGYDTLPSNMSQVAKNLLVNSLYYMQGK